MLKDYPETQVVFKVDAALKGAFYYACKTNDQNASQVLRQFMREYSAKYGQQKLI